MGLDRDKWLRQLEPITNKYNNEEHRTIHMTPNQTKKEGKKLMVSFKLWNNAKKKSKEVYKVTFIKDNDYMMNYSKRKLYQRHELLKV